MEGRLPIAHLGTGSNGNRAAPGRKCAKLVAAGTDLALRDSTGASLLVRAAEAGLGTLCNDLLDAERGPFDCMLILFILHFLLQSKSWNFVMLIDFSVGTHGRAVDGVSRCVS